MRALTILILFAVLASFQAQAACISNLSDEMTVDDRTWCQGTYYINDTDGDGDVFRFGTFDDVICENNNVTIIGNFSSIGVNWNGGSRGSITGCTFMNYNNNYAMQGNSYQVNITDCTSISPKSTQFYILGKANRIRIVNFTSHSNNASHGIYVSPSDDSSYDVRIINSTFYNNSGAGIQINSVSKYAYSMIVSGNNITNNSGSGIQMYAANNASVYDNVIEHNGGSAIQFGHDSSTELIAAKDNRIYDNTIFNNSVVRTFFFNNGTFNNSVYDNTYLDSNITVSVRTQNVSFSMNEDTSVPLYLQFGEVYPYDVTRRINLNYSSRKNFTVDNATAVLWSLGAPFNDVWNETSQLYSSLNNDTFSVAPEPGGNYTIDSFECTYHAGLDWVLNATGACNITETLSPTGNVTLVDTGAIFLNTTLDLSPGNVLSLIGGYGLLELVIDQTGGRIN